MKWLIAEDALHNKQGHWGEYISTFLNGLETLGDSVEILCAVNAEEWLITHLKAKPVLPKSIWAKVSDDAPRWKKLLRIPYHGWSTWKCVRKQWISSQPSTVIFVPTVLVHHLLGWCALIQGTLRKSKTTVLLFFPNTPVKVNPLNGKGYFPQDPTARLFSWLIRCLAMAVKEGRVILGAETEPMKKALEEATGVPFQYFPHPVPAFAKTDTRDRPLTMAVYGPARHEKGSDILQSAIEKHLKAFPESRTRFVIQWLDDFADDKGNVIHKSNELQADSRVEYVTSYFEPNSYAQRLGATDLLLLPYRRSSYDLRVSRVVIEAMVHGIPVIATLGTTLEQQARVHGACIPCVDGSAESLADAIREAEQGFTALRESAMDKRESALKHFSVSKFRNAFRI